MTRRIRGRKFPQSAVYAFAGGGGGGYTGPGDINGAAVAWYGLRAYNAAYATGANPSIDVVDSSGANTTTIKILAGGDLDYAALATFVGAHGAASISKLYDQAGTRHMTQATVANMPTFQLSPAGLTAGRGAMKFIGSVPQGLVAASSMALTQPSTIAAVGIRTSFPGSFSTLFGDTGGTGLLFNSTSGTLIDYAGVTSGSVTAAENTWHSAQGVPNATASKIDIDGTTTTGLSSGGTGITTPCVGVAGSSFPLTGMIAEGGFWSTDKSANFAAINANAHTYWGF